MARDIRRRDLLRPMGAGVLLLQLACGGSPTTPLSHGANVTLARVDVTAPGAAGMSVAPGQNLQLMATAFYSDDTKIDVTSTAVWQSSDPAIAVATSTGLVKAGQVGHVDISAAVSGVAGKAGIDVTAPGTPGAPPASSCATAALSVNSSSITPFNNVLRVTVTTPFSDCRWTATSDSPWLNPGDQSLWESATGSFYDPGRSGDGGFTYTASANRTLLARTARVRVNFTDGTQLTYTVTQGAPTCAITISPGEQSYPYVASSGTFSVHVEPSTCSWTAWVDPRTSPAWNLHASGGGTGDGIVSYSSNPTPPNLTSIAFWIHVIPSNPADPPARFHFWLGPHL